jgi:group I intron endonuclease
MIIYKITNKLNNKIYIGQTTKKMSVRFAQHCGTNNSSYISRAIKKYGKNNFIVEEICCAKSLEDLNFLEIFFISKLNTLKPKGYNIEYGGDNIKRVRSSMSGKQHSEATRLRMSEAHKGKKLSAETKKKLSVARKGVPVKPEVLKNRSNNLTGIRHRGKEVVSTQNNQVFKSIVQACEHLKLARRTVSRWLKQGINKNIIAYKE